MLRRHTSGVPLVSVVLIFLNEERYLEEAVQSVLEQQLTDWELILVDDGSTDRSTLMARDLAAKDKRIRYIDHPGHQNLGMSASRNLGVSHVTAPYIAFLDADDAWPPDKLAEQVAMLDAMPDVAMVVGAMLYWYSWDPASTKVDCVVRMDVMEERRLEPPERLVATLSPMGAPPTAGITGLVRHNAVKAVGGFEAGFRGLYEDQVFLAKIYLHYPIYISSQTGYCYRQHDSSCCRRASWIDRARVRSVYLQWLESYVGPFGDPRVLATVRRARRYGVLMEAKAEAFNRLPDNWQRRVRWAKREVARIGLIRHTSAWEQCLDRSYDCFRA
jgi:glycosyltransferase involved in cell wall biosynthesis